MFEKGLGDQSQFLLSLRASRVADFRKEIFPHFRYVFQSGFGLFVSAILFTAFIWYTDLIKDVPADWPVEAVGIAALTLTLIRAPLRTYMQAADPVYLLAMESRLIRVYLRPAFKAAVWSGFIRVSVLFALYAPLYARSPRTVEFAQDHRLVLLVLLFAGLSIVNLYGGWRERQSASSGWRISLQLIRWLLTIAIVAGLLLKSLLPAVIFMLLSICILWLLWRLPSRHRLPWEKLIDEEQAVRRRWMSFLGWFVDVPTEISKPVRRRWITWVGNLLLWQHRWSWHFLYAKSFLRGETFGAYLRWFIAAAAVLALVDHKEADAIIYIVAFAAGGMQLTELKRVRFVESAATIPVSPEARYLAAAAVACAAGITAVLLLALTGYLTRGEAGLQPYYWLLLSAVSVLWCGWWIPRKISRFKDEDED